MSNETEKPEIQPDESQKIEQVKTLPKPGEESVQTETLPQFEEESVQAETLPRSGDASAKADGEVADDQPSQEGEYKANEPEERAEDPQPSKEGGPKATEPDAKAEDPQPNPRLPPTSMHPVKKAVRWVIIGCLAMLIFYQCGYSSGQSDERIRNALRVPEKEVVLQTDLKAIEAAVKHERAMTELQFQAFVNGLEKNLGQLKTELEYQQLWARFASSEDAGRCTKGVHSGYVSCTSGVMADLNEYLARLEARNVCASGEWTAVQSDAPTESAASEASAPQSAPPQVEYQDELVFKFCQRPEFGSSDS